MTAAISSTLPALCLVFLFVLVSWSLGRVNRWDLLDQVSLADNYISNGFLYPSPDSHHPTGASVYFPGLSLILISLSKVGVSNIPIELMLIAASAVFLAFLITQKYVAQRILGKTISWHYFLPSAILFSGLITPAYLAYASEFKPDSIALFIGYLGVLIAFPNNKPRIKNSLGVVLGGFLCGFAVLFKQQYFVFALGIALYSACARTTKRVLFSLSILASLSLAVILLFSINHLSYWTIKVIADDGFKPVQEALKDNYKTIVNLAFFLLIASFISKIKIESLTPKKVKDFFYHCSSVDISWPIWISAAAAFASSLKIGGNQGNSQLAIFLLFPYFLILFRHTKNWQIICIAWITTLSFLLPSSVLALADYSNAFQYRKYAIEHIETSNKLVLTGSNVYFASRIYTPRARVVNYWTLATREGGNDVDLSITLRDAVDTMSVKPDLIFAENFDGIKEVIVETGRYDLVFENPTGLIAKVKQ